MSSEIDEELAAFLVRGAAEGAVRSQLPPMETVLLFWSALSGMVHTADIREGYIQKTIGLSREEFLQHGTRLLLASITKVNNKSAPAAAGALFWIYSAVSTGCSPSAEAWMLWMGWR